MVVKGNLISAKISDEAFEIYRGWANARTGSSMISFAITKYAAEKTPLRAKDREITDLQMNIRGLQNHIFTLHEEVQALSETISDLYTPQKPDSTRKYDSSRGLAD